MKNWKTPLAATAILLSGAAHAQETTEELIAASRNEGGVVIYSSLSAKVWKPVIEGFAVEYPWIKVETLDLGLSEVIDRYYAEKSAGIQTAGIIVNSYEEVVVRLAQEGEALDFRPEAAAVLPEWTMPAPGVFTMSIDPIVMVWNKLLVTEDNAPDSFGKLVKLVGEDPATWTGRIAGYPADLSTTQYGNYQYRVKADGEEAAWKAYDILGPATRIETSGGSIIEKLASGEYLAAYFITAAPIWTALSDPALESVIGWSFVKDGSPASARYITIPVASPSPASSKLFLNYLLSKEGQLQVAKGGRVVYHPDITDADLGPNQYSLQKIQALLGKDGIEVTMNPAPDRAVYDAFMARWKTVFGAN